MYIDGIDYKSFEEIEDEFFMNEGSIKRLVKKYDIKYKSLGRKNLISDKDLTTLLNRNTTDKEKRKEEQSKRMSKLVKEGKLGKKKKTTTIKK